MLILFSLNWRPFTIYQILHGFKLFSTSWSAYLCPILRLLTLPTVARIVMLPQYSQTKMEKCSQHFNKYMILGSAKHKYVFFNFKCFPRLVEVQNVSFQLWQLKYKIIRIIPILYRLWRFPILKWSLKPKKSYHP